MSAMIRANGSYDKRSYYEGWSWLPAAKALQRKGLTLTEIAKQLGEPREQVVQALYWEVVTVREG